MTGNLSALGFRTPWTSDTFIEYIESLVRQGGSTSGHATLVAGGSYECYAIGAGIELWVGLTSEREIVSFSPHFSGTSQMGAAITHFYDEPGLPMDGSIHAWSNPLTDDPESGDTPFVCNVPTAAAVRSMLSLPAQVTLQMAAFAYDAVCYPDDEAYLASQQLEVQFAPESFLPVGLFDFGTARDTAPPRPEARFSGHVESFEQLMKPVTGLAFHALRVHTLGGTYDVVIDPTILTITPQIGGVVEGTFWLSGRIRERIS